MRKILILSGVIASIGCMVKALDNIFTFITEFDDDDDWDFYLTDF